MPSPSKCDGCGRSRSGAEVERWQWVEREGVWVLLCPACHGEDA